MTPAELARANRSGHLSVLLAIAVDRLGGRLDVSQAEFLEARASLDASVEPRAYAWTVSRFEPVDERAFLVRVGVVQKQQVLALTECEEG